MTLDMNVLREKRISMGMTQEELSQKSGITQRIISLAERGEIYPSLNTMFALLDVLGLKLKIVGQTSQEKKITRDKTKKYEIREIPQ